MSAEECAEGIRADIWAAWGRTRPTSSVLHLDTAAVGRSSTATLRAVTKRALREAELGPTKGPHLP